MKWKIFSILLIVLLVGSTGCKTAPSSIQTEQSSPVHEYIAVPEQQQVTPAEQTESKIPPINPQSPETNDDDMIIAKFDSINITKQIFNTTKSEIGVIVEDLNKITYTNDYNRWLLYLSDEYRDYFSKPEVLEKVSGSLPVKGISLRTLKDYFTYVFVPSRQNMRVDDIQFVSPTRVYVIMEIAPKSTAAIYILEKNMSEWKLVLKNQ